MFINRQLPIRLVLVASLPQITLAALWASLVFILYTLADFKFLRLPFLPIGTIGTAVAFYIGFKNNSAYDRFWEARKIWGGIVNASRSWANAILVYIYSDATQKQLIYRHCAWLNMLRLQLRRKSRFAAWRQKRQNRYQWIKAHESVLRQDWDTELRPFLSDEERIHLSKLSNPAAQLLRQQSEHLRQLFSEHSLDLFHQIELMRIIEELYALQGKCERIKNTPFPRQYAYFGRVFALVFIALVPFGLLDVFGNHVSSAQIGSGALLPAILMIASSTLIAWVFMTMELVGDNSEDPFERGFNDVPMNALCRSIEIDLRQMLGETEVPEPEQPVGAVLY